MLLLLRKITFYLLALLYLAGTPCIILYALGYSFNAREGEILKTGLVSIVTEPRSATVFFEGKKFSRRTPTVVRELRPGSYHVEITRKGFEPWEKQIEIYPEKATRLDSVILIPRKAEQETLSDRSFHELLPKDFDSKIFAFESDTLDSLWKIDFFFKREVPLGRKLAEGEDIKVLDFFDKPGSSLVVFQVEKKGQRGMLVVDLDHEKRVGNFLPFAQTPDQVEWDSRHEGNIYFLTRGKVSMFDFKNEVFKESIAEDVLGLGVKHDRLLLLKRDYTLVRTHEHGENPETLLEDRFLSEKIFSRAPADSYRIQSLKRDLFQKDLLLFLSNKGALVSNWLPYYLVDQDVLGFKYAAHSDQEKILFWTPDKIGVIDFTREDDTLFERSPGMTILYQNGRNIRDASWVYSDSHIAFLDGSQMVLLEAAGPAPYQVNPLGELSPQTRMLYREKDHALYFLEPSRRRLIQQKLMD